MAERLGAAEGPGGTDGVGGAGGRSGPGASGIEPRTILAPVFAWLAVACVLAVYLNQRGHWRSLEGPEAYRECFGSPPAEGLRLVQAASFRHYRYTGEMLALECYAQAEGEFDSFAAGGPGSVSDWRGAPSLGGRPGLQILLGRHGLTRAPEWFLRSASDDGARALDDNQGKWFYVRAGEAGAPRLLIGGGWLTTNR